MESSLVWKDADEARRAILADLQALPVRNAETLRAVRRKHSLALRDAGADFILQLARELNQTGSTRWIAYELIENHPLAFGRLGRQELEEFGKGINSWWSVDAFARTLAGPAWLKGQISDEVILEWAHSTDLWWRRAALVSTVALNVRSKGGYGDVPRTLRICRLLAGDHEDMVVKGLSWALRELVVHDAGAVREFLNEYDPVLAGRVKREVRSKLETGLKNPKRWPKTDGAG